MLAIIGGSGFDQWPELEIIERKRLTTPYGDTSADLLFSQINNQPCVLLSRHGQPHAIAPHLINYRANMWALYECGVTHVIATAAVGAIEGHLHEPCLLVPHDLLDYTFGRQHTFSDEQGKLQHIDFTYPYDEPLRQMLLSSAKRIGQQVFDQGVYAVVQGPRLETAAEVQKLRHDGATVIGMTGMPEAALARELGMQYASIAMCVNPAAGTVQEVISLENIMQNLRITTQQVQNVLNNLHFSC